MPSIPLAPDTHFILGYSFSGYLFILHAPDTPDSYLSAYAY